MTDDASVTAKIDRVTDILMDEFEPAVDEYYASDEKHRIRENMAATARRIVAALVEEPKT